MKKGIELITEERTKQVESGKTIKFDSKFNPEMCKNFAVFCISGLDKYFPAHIGEWKKRKLLITDPMIRLKMAGALVAAQLDQYHNKYLGLKLIAEERRKQINDGKRPQFDVRNNSKGQLQGFAMFALTSDPSYFPKDWDVKKAKEFKDKTEIEKLTIAGALIAAEIDRIHQVKLNYTKHFK